jgi:hypothetical protein
MLARGFRRVKRVARKRAAKLGVEQVGAFIGKGPDLLDDPDLIIAVPAGFKKAVVEVVAEDAQNRAYHGDISLARAVEEMKRPRALSKTTADYIRAWEIEKAHRYKAMDALEERYGYAIDKDWLDAAARVMACPIKRNAPNWQHGRLVYALARHRIAQGGEFVFFETGSAKGFSAACMALAVQLSGHNRLFDIWSVDVIDPCSNEPRNSVLDGQVHRGIWDYCERFIGVEMLPHVHFVQDGDTAHIGFLSRTDRIGFAFVDGDHSYEGVARDIVTIIARQQAGDIILFDDVQLPRVWSAVNDLASLGYSLEQVRLTPSRSYAIAVRQ